MSRHRLIGNTCVRIWIWISRASYQQIQNLPQGYQHLTVNHNINFLAPNQPNVHTQSVEATWGSLKKHLREMHAHNRKLWPTYIYNYMFRRAHNNEKIFQNILYWIAQYYDVA